MAHQRPRLIIVDGLSSVQKRKCPGAAQPPRGLNPSFRSWGAGVFFWQMRAPMGPVAFCSLQVLVTLANATAAAPLMLDATRHHWASGCPRSFNSAAMARAPVIPWTRRSSTMALRFAARCSAFALTAATAYLCEIDRLQRTEETIVVATGAPRERGCSAWVVLGVKAVEARGTRAA
jgi:hypothetical protein